VLSVLGLAVAWRNRQYANCMRCQFQRHMPAPCHDG
jgi:hypothetical protein